MMIYTDGRHIVSDKGVQELHWFAERVRIGRFYFDEKKEAYKRPSTVSAHTLYEKGARYGPKTVQEKIKDK